MVLRTRSSYAIKTSGKFGTGTSVANQNYTVYPIEVKQTQTTESFGHAWPPAKGAKGDIGGPFSTQNSYAQMGSANIDSLYATSAGARSYVGPIVASVDSWPLLTLGGPSSGANLDALGTTAIARSIPTNPSADLSQMLGELLISGVPKAIGAQVLKSKFKDPRAIGSEFLNWEFGWKPLVNDLREVAKAVSDSEKIITQLQRDSGRNVRRRFRFPTLSEQAVQAGIPGNTYRAYPALNQFVYTGGTGRVIRDYIRQDAWFAGCFTYKLQLPDKANQRLADHAKQARLLLGVDLSPDVVWNLAPWSWLADWVSNAGDIATNVSRFSKDGLVLRYGYIMEHTLRERTVEIQGLRAYNKTRVLGSPFSLSSSFYVESKQRRPATPYGFGLDTGGFSDRQWAILGALGISKLPRSL